MELVSRAFLSKLIKSQLNKEVQNKTEIYRLLKIKPYKKEGKSWLYKVSEINKVGIVYKRNIKGFQPIPKFEDKFWINKKGEVMNVTTEEIVKSYIGVDLYEHIILMYYGKKYRRRVHTLMGVTFLGNPQVVHHIDENKSNNNLSNLKRSTHKENIAYAKESSNLGQWESVLVKAICKSTKEIIEFPSMRKAQAYTNIDRHIIKRLAEKSITNNTNWEFEVK